MERETHLSAGRGLAPLGRSAAATHALASGGGGFVRNDVVKRLVQLIHCTCDRDAARSVRGRDGTSNPRLPLPVSSGAGDLSNRNDQIIRKTSVGGGGLVGWGANERAILF